MTDDPHQVLVQYDRDHYICLECRCGWQERVSYAPTPTELWIVEQRHRRESGGEGLPVYGTVVLGGEKIEPVTDDLSGFQPVGWAWNGEVHYFERPE